MGESGWEWGGVGAGVGPRAWPGACAEAARRQHGASAACTRERAHGVLSSPDGAARPGTRPPGPTCGAVAQLAAAAIPPSVGFAAGCDGGRVGLARRQRGEGQACECLHLAGLQQQRQVAGHAALPLRVGAPARTGGAALGGCGGRRWQQAGRAPAGHACTTSIS